MGFMYESIDLANAFAQTNEWPPGALDVQLQPGQGYGDVLVELGFDLRPEAVDFFNQTPPVVADTIINTYRSGQVHGARVRAAWLPGADYEATVAHVGGEVTLLLRSPSPGGSGMAS